MQNIGWVLIALGLILWVQRSFYSTNDVTPPLGENREKIQNIDSRMYR
jgi:hypothetical protein